MRVGGGGDDRARAKRSSAHGANIFDHGHMTEIQQVVGACMRDPHFELGR